MIMEYIERTSTKDFSILQETTVAKYLNWGVVSGSGSRAGAPGDIVGAHFLGECKTHTEPGHKIHFNSAVWKKLKEEATSKFSFPVLVVDDGSQRIDKTWCMFPYTIVAPAYSRFEPLPVDYKVNLNFDHTEVASFYRDKWVEIET